MIFEEEKMDTCRVVPNCYRTPIPKFHFEIMLLFIVTQGLAGPHTMLTVTLKSATTTNSKNQGVLGKHVFFDLFELKMTKKHFPLSKSKFILPCNLGTYHNFADFLDLNL